MIKYITVTRYSCDYCGKNEGSKDGLLPVGWIEARSASQQNQDEYGCHKAQTYSHFCSASCCRSWLYNIEVDNVSN